MSETVKSETGVHPADALALALDRANALLIVLMDLYNSQREEFVGGNPFVVHGMSTVSDLMDEARAALADLHVRCDLSLTPPAGVTSEGKPATSATSVLTLPKPDLKPIAAAVVTLKEADETPERIAKSYR